MTNQDRIKKLVDNRQQALMGGGEKAVEKHHAKGSYTARNLT